MGWAFADIVTLWIAIGCTIIGFSRIHITAAWLLVPYICWVSFAAVLNYVLWQMNGVKGYPDRHGAWRTHHYRDSRLTIHVSRLKSVLPHHTFYRLIGLPVVFGIFFLIIGNLNFTFYREIDELANGHEFINAHRLFYRYLQCPVTAKTHIALARCSMYINTQPAGRRLAFLKKVRVHVFLYIPA